MAQSNVKQQANAAKQAQKPISGQLPSSSGNSPQEISPKDVVPGHAAWADITVRDIASEDPDIRQEALLDEAVDQTFPASDPVAELPTHAMRQHLVCEDEEEELLDEAIELTFPASDPIAVATPTREHWVAHSLHYKP